MQPVPAEECYFPPGRSLARRVHGERSVGLLYGQRALLIGALEPLTYTGTMLSTKAGEWPFTRLARTAKIQETVFLGTREEADKALGAVHRLHERIKGTLPEAAGAHPAGAAYSAFDPELMLWTLAVIADSGRAMYEAMVRPLSADERERLWQDYVRFGELFGLPASAVPASYREFDAWWWEKLRSPDLHATPHALEYAPLVAFEQPVPPSARGNVATQNLIVKGTLPPRVREIFGIEWGRRHEAAFRAITAAHRRARPAFPRRLRRGRNDYFFDIVTESERRRGGTPRPATPAGAGDRYGRLDHGPLHGHRTRAGPARDQRGAALMATLTIEARFNGPSGSGNGGYSAGLLAAELEGPAVVSLRSPVPLDRPLSLVREDGVVRALDGETLVAEAEPAAALNLDVPAPVAAAEAREAMRDYSAPLESPFSRCFVCGPAREDCMEVFASQVPGRDGLVATTWTPPAWSAGADGAVRPEFVWAALDCPTYFAVYGREPVLGFLVRQQVEIEAPIRAGVEHVVLSWPLAADGRKRTAGAAVLGPEGEPLARGEALMVEPR